MAIRCNRTLFVERQRKKNNENVCFHKKQIGSLLVITVINVISYDVVPRRHMSSKVF